MTSAILLIASAMCGQTFTVTNRVPPTPFTVVNRCYDPFAVENKTRFAPKTKLTAFRTQTVITTRAPVGHTHTCANGHVWDHTSNPGHVCQFCGAVQTVQDRSPRPVTVVRTVQVQAEAPAPQTRVPARAAQPAVFVVAPRGAANCANGSCQYAR